MIINAAVVLYNPDNSIDEKILEYAKVFDTLYIVDNSPQNSINADKIPDNAVYLPQKENIGLPAAYNLVLSLLCANTSFLCTLDQDSTFNVDDIQKMKEVVQTLNNDIAIIAPHIIYDGNPVPKNDRIVYRRYDITSGSFVNIKLLKKLGMSYDENYFIDKFEVDLCQQFIMKGYKIAEYEGAFLFQQLGEYSGHRHPNHSQLRHYYLFRNRFYFNKKFFPVPKRIVLNILQTGRHELNILLYEKEKLSKMTMIFPASSDYIRGNMGKREIALSRNKT